MFTVGTSLYLEQSGCFKGMQCRVRHVQLESTPLLIY